MISARTNLLLALREAKGEPILENVLLSTVSQITRIPRGDVEGELRGLEREGMVTSATDAATNLPACALTTKGQVVANQIR